MLSIDSQNYIDTDFNGGFNASNDLELINLRPSSGETLLNAHRIQRTQSSPTTTVTAKQNSTLVQSNSKCKKSVMLNLKSGAINSTVEEFGNFSTQFNDTFTQNRRHYRFWLLAVGIVISCLCCFVFGLRFNYLFDTQPCGKISFYSNHFRLSASKKKKKILNVKGNLVIFDLFCSSLKERRYTCIRFLFTSLLTCKWMWMSECLHWLFSIYPF